MAKFQTQKNRTSIPVKILTCAPLGKNVERLLLNAANDESFDEEFQKVADFHKDDFNSGLLRTQLESLNASFKENKDISRVDMKAILKYFRSTLPAYRTFYSEVISYASYECYQRKIVLSIKVNRQRPTFVMRRPELKIPTLARWLISPLLRVIIKICKNHLVLKTKSNINIYNET